MPVADTALPASVQQDIGLPLDIVGTGTFRKFGFRIYDAILFSQGGVWSSTKPFALQITYRRDLPKSIVLDSVTSDLRDQNVADDDTLKKWTELLDTILPPINDGDTLIAVTQHNKPSQLFYNGAKIATLDDPVLSKAFFDIWLGDKADSELRDSLLNDKPSP